MNEVDIRKEWPVRLLDKGLSGVTNKYVQMVKGRITLDKCNAKTLKMNFYILERETQSDRLH